jgi:hypothetical protein
MEAILSVEHVQQALISPTLLLDMPNSLLIDIAPF